MITPLLLLGYVVTVAAFAPRLLRTRHTLWRAPKLGLVVWQSSVLGTLSALLLLLVGALIPTSSVSVDWGHLVHACSATAASATTLTGLGGMRLMSSVIAGTTLARLLWAALTRTVALVRARRRQRDMLDLLAPDRDGSGPAEMHVLASEVPTAYCIPGRRGRIVLTSGAVRVLSSQERAAVVAHERAHLRGRHDLVLLGADIAARALGRLGFYRTARTQMSWLLEMLADDIAARCTAREAVASALTGLGTHPVPDAAVAAAAHIVPARVARLLDEQPQPSPLLRASTVVAALVVAATPWALALAPVVAARSGLCQW